MATDSTGSAALHRQPEESLVALAATLVTGQSLEKTLRQILELACAVLPDADEGGITLLDNEGPGAVIATSDTALRADRAQYAAATGGPGLEAYRRQQVVRIESTATDGRWPDFAAAAALAGFASTLSVPLIVGGDGLGALNLYCRRACGFPASDERLAALLGSCASVALANARTYWRAARLADQLEEALATRGAIDQAAGIIIARRGCSAERAHAMLAAAAERNRLGVAEVAADVVDRARHGEPPG